MTTTTHTAGIRLTDEDVRILDEIQARIGVVTQSDAFRFALRFWANAEGIGVKPKPRKAAPQP